MSQDDLRIILLDYMISNPIGFDGLAIDIGISTVTLKGLVWGKRTLRPDTWRKADNFVKKMAEAGDIDIDNALEKK